MDTKQRNINATTSELYNALLNLVSKAISAAELPRTKDECTFHVRVRFIKPNFKKSSEIMKFKVFVDPMNESISCHELNPIRVYALSQKVGRVEFRNDFNHTYNLSAYLLTRLDDAKVLNQVISLIIKDDFSKVDEIITSTFFECYPQMIENCNHLGDIQLTWKRVAPNVSKAVVKAEGGNNETQN